MCGAKAAGSARPRPRPRRARRGSGPGPRRGGASGPHPAPTAKARWRVNAAGGRRRLLPPLSPLQRGPPPLKATVALSAGRRGSGRAGGAPRSLPRSGLLTPSSADRRGVPGVAIPAMATGGIGEERGRRGRGGRYRVGSLAKVREGRGLPLPRAPAGPETSPVPCGDEQRGCLLSICPFC